MPRSIEELEAENLQLKARLERIESADVDWPEDTAPLVERLRDARDIMQGDDLVHGNLPVSHRMLAGARAVKEAIDILLEIEQGD